MKLPIQLSQQSREPIYHQIEKQLKALIAGEQLAAGSSLPSIRVLSKELGVSVITTRRAYQNLENDGFIETKQGKGTFVADVEHEVKEKTKEAAVYDAFESAIRTALHYDYTKEEMIIMFEKLIQTKRGDNK